MTRIPGIRRWLRIARPANEQAGADVEDELSFHIAMRIRELMAAGMAEAEARMQTQREFGDMASARQQLVRATRRREWRGRVRRWLEESMQDVRFGARVLLANRLFTIVAVLTLALGVGVNTAMFGLVNAVLLRPLPYGSPEELVRLYETRPPEIPRNVVSRGNYLDWVEQARSFAGMGAFMQDFGYGLTGSGEPVQLTGAQITPSLFDVLGVPALRGRTFVAEEGVRGGASVVLVSYGLWQTRFGGDDDVLGRVLTIDGSPYEVVGVMPPTFQFPSRETEIWLPLTFAPADRVSREAHMLSVIARLRDGVTVEAARGEMRRVAAAIGARFPEFMDGYSADVFALRADLTRRVRQAMLVLSAAVGLVLLVACANVTNLVLARSLARDREVAVRAALGAGRGRLVRQFLTESALLALLGGLAGLALAAGAIKLAIALDPGDVPLIQGARLDRTVLLFAAVASAIALCGFAILPALRGARADLRGAMRDDARGGGSTRQKKARSALLVAEVAASIVLLVGAGLLVRSFVALNAIDPGLETEGVLTARLNLPTPAYADPARQVAFYEEAIERLRATPGVMAAAGTSEPPVVGYFMTRSIVIDGYSFAPGERDDVQYRAVTPGFFETLRVDLVAGRTLTVADRAGSTPVIMVNEAMARRYWPDANPVGGRVRFEDNGPWYEVVGIAGAVRHQGLDREEDPAIYAPFAQKDWAWLTWMTLLVRTDGDPLAFARDVQEVVWSIDASLPIQEMATMEAVFADSIGRQRFTTSLLALFALMSVALGAIGVYGVIGYAVTQRRREIGVRMALGAARARVVAGIVREGMQLTAIGIVIGLALASLFARALRGLVFGITLADPVAYGGAVTLILILAALASYLPARRAARIEPVKVLRDG
jgi:predicted permease